MIITQFTIVTTLFILILVITVINFWLSKTMYEIQFSSGFLIMIFMIIFVRFLFPFELPFAYVVNSKKVYPAIYDYLNKEIFFAMGLRFSIMTFLLLLWLVGFVFLLLYNCCCYLQVKFCFKKESYSTDKRINMVLLKCLQKGKKPIPVICTELVQEPMLIGLISPIVILPNQYYDENELLGILAHEVSHYNFGDLYIKCFVGILSCLFWWIPQISSLKNQLNCVLEIRADRAVINGKTAQFKAIYLKTLLKTCKNRKLMRPQCVSTAMFTYGDEKTIIKRFRFIASASTEFGNKKSRKFVIAICLAFALLFPFAVVVQPYGDRTGLTDNTYTVEESQVYFIQRDNLYDLYINSQYVETFTEYSGDRRQIPILKKVKG